MQIKKIQARSGIHRHHDDGAVNTAAVIAVRISSLASLLAIKVRTAHLYCCTVHFEDSLRIKYQQMHK
jgi:hypothetical protein